MNIRIFIICNFKTDKFRMGWLRQAIQDGEMHSEVLSQNPYESHHIGDLHGDKRILKLIQNGYVWQAS
jgi:hypothetical protein